MIPCPETWQGWISPYLHGGERATHFWLTTAGDGRCACLKPEKTPLEKKIGEVTAAGRAFNSMKKVGTPPEKNQAQAVKQFESLKHNLSGKLVVLSFSRSASTSITEDQRNEFQTGKLLTDLHEKTHRKQPETRGNNFSLMLFLTCGYFCVISKNKMNILNFLFFFHRNPITGTDGIFNWPHNWFYYQL